MNVRTIALLILTGLCGCSTPPRGAPTDVDGGFRRENAPAFTPQERAAVCTTRHYLEQHAGRRIDAYYRVRPTEGGYRILVFEVSRYEKGQPRFRSGDWGVTVGEDGIVKECVRGY
jgi:hypothetical protein